MSHVSLNGKWLRVNQKLCDMLGYTSEELLLCTFQSITHPDHVQTDQSRLYDLVLDRIPMYQVEKRYIHKSGETLWANVTVSLTRNRDGSPAYFIAVTEDISKRKAAETALLEREKRHAAILETALDALITIDSAGVILEWNTAAETIFGFAREEAAGRRIDSQIIPARLRRKHRLGLKRLLATGKSTMLDRRVETAAVRSDGSEIPVELAVHRITMDGPPLFTACIRDISGKREAQQRVRLQFERLTAFRAVDAMILSHLDLHTTLSLVVDQAVSVLGIHAAAFFSFRPERSLLEFVVEREIPLGEGLLGRAGADHRILSSADLLGAERSLMRRRLATGEFKECYAVPLIVKGELRGVLKVATGENFEPDREWLEFLETLGGQAALAIDNAVLLDNLQRVNTELSQSYEATIEGWSHALDLRDEETEGHSRRVTEMTLRLAEIMGIGAEERVHMRRGALLHDIGKMGVPDHILHKRGPLTEDEWQVMRRHPQLAYEMLQQAAFLRPALGIPLCHHEKWDGTGYPNGLAGTQIPIAARIFAVADVFDALSSNRPYRAAWPPDKVVEHIKSLSGTHFDPNVVSAFLTL
jgi:PAS domain S-box-containing protein/putative nucleotidyltransferase with HDIG domain